MLKFTVTYSVGRLAERFLRDHLPSSIQKRGCTSNKERLEFQNLQKKLSINHYTPQWLALQFGCWNNPNVHKFLTLKSDPSVLEFFWDCMYTKKTVRVVASVCKQCNDKKMAAIENSRYEFLWTAYRINSSNKIYNSERGVVNNRLFGIASVKIQLNC